MSKVLVAMSGGVDSSLAAYLLLKEGHDCIGVTMKLYSQEVSGLDPDNACCSLDDVEDARRVCEQLGIEHRLMDFSEQFEEKVIQKFIRCYESGLTPNPCVDCNRHLKFSRLISLADELGCDFIATGHYARMVRDGRGGYSLCKGLDRRKDQSYVLYNLDKNILSRVLFPLGEMTKDEVRQYSANLGLVSAGKQDSQDICFIPDGDYVGFLERVRGKAFEPGDLRDLDGRVLGKHKGAVAYTIGQRKGLGLSGPEPVYVIDKDMKTNEVIVGPDRALYARSLIATDWNWLIEATTQPIRASAKVRYAAPEKPCTITPLEDGRIKLIFDDQQRAIAPGQAVVAYLDDAVIGGGTIRELADRD